MDTGTMVLHRFNGVEEFRIKSASMKAFASEGNSIKLFLYVDTKKRPVRQLPDTAVLTGARPNAEVYITLKKFEPTKLVGKRFSVPLAFNKEEDEYDACIYYCDHKDLDRNVIRVLERTGNKFLIHWTGQTGDMNYYDGSKPDAKVEIKAWFTFKNMRQWKAATS